MRYFVTTLTIYLCLSFFYCHCIIMNLSYFCICKPREAFFLKLRKTYKGGNLILISSPFLSLLNFHRTETAWQVFKNMFSTETYKKLLQTESNRRFSFLRYTTIQGAFVKREHLRYLMIRRLYVKYY